MDPDDLRPTRAERTSTLRLRFEAADIIVPLVDLADDGAATVIMGSGGVAPGEGALFQMVMARRSWGKGSADDRGALP